MTLEQHLFDACTIVDSTVLQPLNRRLCNRWFAAGIVVDSTLVQLSIRRLYNHWFDTCRKRVYFNLFLRQTFQTSTQTFLEKNFLEILFNILHIGASANTTKVMVDAIGLIKQNLNFKLDQICRLYSKLKCLIFLALTQKTLCKNCMNNNHTFSFLTGIIQLFNMTLTNMDEVI